MGSYLNPGNFSFKGSLRSKIYVDKSKLIAKTNEVLCTEQKYICVSRPRRFGKSMAANMLAAYYARSENTEELFQNLVISKDVSYKENLNQYDVIKINMQEFLSMAGTMEDMLGMLKNYLISDFAETYPEVRFRDEKNLIQVMKDVFSYTRCPFVILIDEWDCLFREYKQDKEAQKKYLDFLRVWLKDKDYVAMAYMTGILPIKKYGSHSALNMFTEYSMTDPGDFAEYFGFTEQEVLELCEKYEMSFEEAKIWYDGYQLVVHRKEKDECYSMYSPKSVVEAMLRGKFSNYWTQTETYEALKIYIQSNEFGVQDVILKLLAGEKEKIDTTTFSNDMVTFATKDDVLTLLVHLGYLTYDAETKEIWIPNDEVIEQFISTVKVMGWGSVVTALETSEKLLQATLSGDEQTVAELIEQAHQANASILKYNDENALSCVISLAYYSAQKNYTLHREMPAGKGFADIVFEPNRNCNLPALIVELKWGHSAEEAIEQIKRKDYLDCLQNYHGEVLLVGVNYDKEKHHTCKIERVFL